MALPEPEITDHHALAAAEVRLFAHDLNNPLTAIRILAEMLRDELGDSPMQRDVVDLLEAADTMGALMEGLVATVRDPDEELTWFPVDLVEVLRSCVARPALRRVVRLDLPRELHCGGDRIALQRALTDVLMNGRRLLDRGQELVVTAREVGASVEVRVRHPGVVIPRALRTKLFEPYGAVGLRQQRIPVSAGGLVYAHEVVDGHGGSIELVDAEQGAMDAVIRLRR